MNKYLQWIVDHKALSIIVVVITALSITVLSLGIVNGDLSTDLNECQELLRESILTSTSASSETPATTEDPNPEGTTTEMPTTGPPIDNSLYKLPDHVIPVHYDLHLEPIFESGLFKGTVIVDFEIKESTKYIYLHNNGLTCTLADAAGISMEYNKDFELIVLSKNDQTDFAPETKQITINFEGDMTKRIVGLYTSTYTENNVVRQMATSKFEPTYARQAYPCFDEPDKKANFTVHLVIPNKDNYIALSNMPQNGEEVLGDGSRKRVDFEESVRMSTYLSCFIVSDFQYTEDKIASTFGDVNLRVYSTPAQVNKTLFALDVAKNVTEYFVNEYFHIPYPLPKLDLVAIPDFVSGAMEHWGLVTFRETALLIDDETSSTLNKQRVAVVVAHEIAHSWFGNLVTMKWWDDLWLNEGFATYISFKGIDQMFPDWEMLNQFPIEELHPVLVLDATLGSHPIIVKNILTPDEITEIFDTITYNKGASILRMLEDAVGAESFETGVKKYLEAHQYENAITENLLDKLQEIVGAVFNVKEFMETFTVQMGYPIINIVKVEGKQEYVLKQARFLTNSDTTGKHIKESIFNYKWTVPITYITDKNDTVERLWFKHDQEEITITPDFTGWFKVNCDQIGYYRVNYPEQIWHQLSQDIVNMKNSDKAHLIDDAFAIAGADQLNYTIAMELTKFLKSDFNYVPWAVAAGKIHQIKSYLMNSNSFNDLKKYVTDLVDDAYTKYSWIANDTDSHVQKRARLVILDLACTFGHEACLDEAKQLFTDWIKPENLEPLPQDTRQLIYVYGMAGSGQTEWDILWERFIAETDAAEKLKLLNGLASTKDVWLLTRLIDLAKDDTYIRSQDYFSCLQYIAGNPSGTALVWDYVRENWLALVTRFGLNDRYLGRLIPAITKSFSSELKLDEMNIFFVKYPEAGAGAAARRQALEQVQNNINWLSSNKDSVESWLKQWKPE